MCLSIMRASWNRHADPRWRRRGIDRPSEAGLVACAVDGGPDGGFPGSCSLRIYWRFGRRRWLKVDVKPGRDLESSCQRSASGQKGIVH